jgi:hypothetical protein
MYHTASPKCPKFWRSTRSERAPSINPALPREGGTFGLKVPIVDFFSHDYITKFVPLEDILRGKTDEIMKEAYMYDPTEESHLPLTSGGCSFRWIHIPYNNMVWVEVRGIKSIFTLAFH